MSRHKLGLHDPRNLSLVSGAFFIMNLKKLQDKFNRHCAKLKKSLAQKELLTLMLKGQKFKKQYLMVGRRPTATQLKLPSWRKATRSGMNCLKKEK